MNTSEFLKQFYANYGVSDVKTGVADKVYLVYLNAQKNRNLFCIMGRLDTIRDTIGSVKGDSGLLVNDTGFANIPFTDEAHTGNVLNSDSWNIAVNDAWVLGGIEGRSTFNFISAGDVVKETFFDRYIKGSGRFPVTVTAREIIGLMCYGYEPAIVKGALVFKPGRSSEEPTIAKYVTNIKNHIEGRDLEYIRRLIHSYIF